MDLISINEAAKRGIDRLRKPKWKQPEDHLKIDIIDGRAWPWVHLYAPFNRECNGRDPVHELMLQGTDEAEWLPYTGPLPDSDEYKAVQAKFDGCLGSNAGVKRRAVRASALNEMLGAPGALVSEKVLRPILDYWAGLWASHNLFKCRKVLDALRRGKR